jgi:hypothetical protein
MQRSSSSIASLAAALAKAQAELINPEKSLVATIRSDGSRGAEQTFRYAPLSSGLDIPRATINSCESFPAPFHQLGIAAAKLKGRIKPWRLALSDAEYAVETGVHPGSKSQLNTIAPGAGRSSMLQRLMRSVRVSTSQPLIFSRRILRASMHAFCVEQVGCLGTNASAVS